ncbi:NAD(P)/FAD-dependent oxidoreductase [Methylomonas sp. DH-1]|uniref:flavin monoamine oxidase family protein n=1 Tax=Methylomonas sp. (strain DH-1) TaxID=1727196 RepID=UPI0009EEFABB|nr:NAD(P)/FAD-dependent oxidoreductase [Methylomonas sp. DH-1]
MLDFSGYGATGMGSNPPAVRRRSIKIPMCLLLLLVLALPPAAAKNRHSDVIVVGAGLSGLSAAYYLRQAGKSVTVLEMSPHIGGRIRTAHYADAAHAEIGLEEFWSNNPAVELFRSLKIPLETSYSSFSSFYYRGRLYPFTQDSNRAFLAAILDPAQMTLYQAWDSRVAELQRQLAQKPLSAELRALQDISFADWIETESGLPETAQQLVRIETEPEFATSWRKISALEGIAEWRLFSGDGATPFHVVGGNQRAADKLADAVGRKRIRLNQLVTHIAADADGVAVTAVDQSDFRQRVYRADYAITAIPLFRLNDIQFEPALSAERKQAIQTQSAGAYFTAHVFVDPGAERFWTVQGQSVLPILSDGPLGVIYAGRSQPGRDILLNLLVSGASAERFNSRAGDPDQIREELLAGFERLWPGIRPAIKRMQFYRYHPRAVASWPVGRSRFDELSDALRTGQGRIYFAGDFTEDTHSNGAVESARRVVRAILAEAQDN